MIVVATESEDPAAWPSVRIRGVLGRGGRTGVVACLLVSPSRRRRTFSLEGPVPGGHGQV